MTTPAPTPAPSRQSKTLRNVLLIIGSIIIVIVLATTAVWFAHSLNREDTSGDFTITDSFDTIDLRATAADVAISYADVAETELNFDQGDTNLTMDRSVSNGTLHVRVEHRGWWGFGDWGFWNDNPATLDIVLPDSMEDDGVALVLDTTAGNLDVDGTFTEVRVESTAGDVMLAGGAEDLEIFTTAGDVRLNDYALRGSLTGESTAGDADYGFRSLPDSMHVSSTAGNVLVELPDGDYRIETDTTAGEIRQDVSSNSDSDRVYRFETTAGDIDITER